MIFKKDYRHLTELATSWLTEFPDNKPNDKKRNLSDIKPSVRDPCFLSVTL